MGCLLQVVNAINMLLKRFLLPVGLCGVMSCAGSGHSGLKPLSAINGIIAIDVGHTHLAPGSTSARGRTEFAFNSDLAGQVHDYFADSGLVSVLIGADGNMASLSARTDAAENASARFFLSLHHDSVQPHYLKPWRWQGRNQRYCDDFSGFSLFVSRKNRNFADSLNCASAIGLALKMQGFRPSTHHAEALKGENKSWADQTNGVYFYDNLVVLKTAEMPAVLLEAGIIVNRADELRLQDAAVRQKIAQAIGQGLETCGIVTRVK